MTEPQLTPAQIVLGHVINMKFNAVIHETSYLAEALGTHVTVAQLLAGLTSATWTADFHLTRDQFTAVWDYVATLQAGFEAMAADQFGPGPEAAADAETPEDARMIADHWSGRIENAAFNLSVPETLGDFPPEDISG